MTTEQQHERNEPKELQPIGQSILEYVRTETNDEQGHFSTPGEPEDVFRELYLSERFVCIPDNLLGEDILVDIHKLYYTVFDGIRHELQERTSHNEPISVLVDPSYEDSTSAAMITEDKVLLIVELKAWQFYWPDEHEMAEELESWYGEVVQRLGLADSLATESSTPKESLETLDFEDFDHDKLSGLTNWDVMEVEPGRRWFFSHKELDDGENETYQFEVYRPPSPMEGTMDVNRVYININTPHNHFQGHLLGVQSFSFGISGIDLPGEGHIVRFFGKDDDSLEIRNDGTIWTRKLSDASYIPDKP